MIFATSTHPDSAHAACIGAGPPYTITTQATSVDLDTDCAGVGGAVTVTGDVSSAGSAGIIDFGGFESDWSVTVNNGVTVDANAIGVFFGSFNGSLINNGTITTENLNAVQMNFAGTVTNSGRIEGERFSGGDGVIMQGGGSVINLAGGEIIGGREGVDMIGGIGTVTNAGTIRGLNGEGVALRTGGTVTNQAGGTIIADHRAVLSTGPAITVDNAGTITSLTDDGVQFDNGGTVTNQTGATITGARSGIEGNNTAISVTNAGTITGQGDWGILLGNGGTVTNQVGGEIDGDGEAGIESDGSMLTVINSGTIRSQSESGIHAGDGGTITNHTGASIIGSDKGVFLVRGGTLTNETGGVIVGGTVGVETNRGIGTVTNAGRIEGQTEAAIHFLAGGMVTNETGGVITGNDAGIEIDGAIGTVTNAGRIESRTDLAINLIAGGTVTNETGGTIMGDEDAVAIHGGVGTVTNSGTITARTGFGVQLGSGGTVTNRSGATIRSLGTGAGVLISGGIGNVDNAGTLTGDDDKGVELTGGGTIINRAGGLIRGEADEAIQISGAAGNVANAGRIENINGGPAVLFAGFDDRFEVQPGSVIVQNNGGVIARGEVQAGGGTDTLVFGGVGTSTFDISQIDGDNTNNGEQYHNFETFIKEDASTFTFTGTNSEIGAFVVNGGTLVHNGALTNGVFTVNNGGTLGGTGSSAGLTFNTGSLVAPGNSIGTTQVNGNVVFNGGSTYQVEIDNTPASDLINATGTATLNGGTVEVVTLSPEASFADGTVFTILTAAGGVAGTFASLTETSAFLDFLLSYDANNVFLTSSVAGGAATVDFTTPAQTPNQHAAATGLNGLDQTAGSDAATVFNAVALLSAPQSRAAFDVTSGEVHASAQRGVLDVADLFTSTLHRRAGLEAGARGAAQALSFSTDVQDGMLGTRTAGVAAGEPLAAGSDVTASAWGSALASRGEYDGDGNAAAFDQDVYGFAGGFDFAGMWNAMNAMGGIAAGFTEADADASPRRSKADISSWHAGIYGALDKGPLKVSGVVSYAAHEIDTTRSIVFPGISRVAKASYDADTFAASAEASWRFALTHETHSQWTIAPLLRMDVLTGSHNGATETGAGTLDLNVASRNYDRVDGGPGVSLGYSGVIESWDVSADVRATWLHAFDDSNPTQTLAFAGAPTTPFTTRGVNWGADRLALGGGLNISLSDRVFLTTGYGASFFGNATNHQGHVALNISLN